MTAAIDLDPLKQRAVQFARHTSTEIPPHDEGVPDTLAGVLPAGTRPSRLPQPHYSAFGKFAVAG